MLPGPARCYHTVAKVTMVVYLWLSVVYFVFPATWWARLIALGEAEEHLSSAIIQ